MSKLFYSLLTLPVLLSTCAFAADYNYAELQTKTLDEMTAVVTKQQQKAKRYLKDDDKDSALVALKSAARYTLARPDRDENMVAKVIGPIRSQLRELSSFEKTFNDLITESIAGLKNEKLKPIDRATHYFVLINFMAEFRPDLKMNPQIRPIYEEIKNAKIKLHKKVKQDLEYRGMKKNVTSPSEIAETLLKAEKPATPKPEEPLPDLETES